MEFPGFTRIRSDQCVGKMIATIDYDRWDGIGLRFTDGSFFVVEPESEPEEGMRAFLEELEDLNNGWAAGLGIIADEEYMRLYTAELEKEKARRETAERAEYERLKAKFEGTPAPTGEPNS